MSDLCKTLYVFVLLLSAVSCNGCSPCECNSLNKRISCEEGYDAINSIPVKFSRSVEWNELKMTNQKLTNLPENAFLNVGLTNLTYVIITNSGITSIHEEAFNNMTYLFHLELSHNSLSKLEDNTFKPIQNIKFLYLHHNKLKSINARIFADLSNLQQLDISNNLLTSFSATALVNKNKLSQLYLNNNNLITLNITAIKESDKFTDLKISYNPWICDCLIRDLVDFMRNKNKITNKQELLNVKCSAPEILKGITWQEPEITQDKLNCWINSKAPENRLEAKIGDKAKLKCKVESTAMLTESWKFSDKYINNSSGKYILDTTPIDQHLHWFTLEIANLTEEDEGFYYCIVKSHVTGQMDEAKIKLVLLERGLDLYSILIIVGLMFCAVCLVIIFFKCAIRFHIVSRSKDDQPNFQDSFKDDDSSVHSLKIDKIFFCDDCPPCKCDFYYNSRITCDENTNFFDILISVPEVKYTGPVTWDEITLRNQLLYNLSANAFSDVGLTSLSYIIVNYCRISDIHEDAFNNVTYLINIDLAHNDLFTLPDNTFKPVKYIKYLNLNYNKFEYIDDKIFKMLPRLEILEITNNFLKVFNKNALINSKILKQLNLSYNKLTSLNISEIQSLEKFSILQIAGNPWTCDCFMTDLWVFMKNNYEMNTSIYREEFTITKCKAPKELRGYSLREFVATDLNCWLYASVDKTGMKAKIGESIQLPCLVYSNTLPNGNWTHNNKNIIVAKEKYNLNTTIVDEVNYLYTLDIYDLTKQDGGTYECFFTNKITMITKLTTRAKINLIVEPLPTNISLVIVITGFVFNMMCLTAIIIKCIIKYSIHKNTSRDHSTYEENFNLNDLSSNIDRQ